MKNIFSLFLFIGMAAKQTIQDLQKKKAEGEMQRCNSRCVGGSQINYMAGGRACNGS